MQIFNVQGVIRKSELAGGNWIIEAADGQTWLPVNLPEQVKYDGRFVRLKLRKLQGVATIFMNGTPAEVIGFSTFMP